MSAHADIVHIDENCNCDDFIAKPFDLDFVLNKIANYL